MIPITKTMTNINIPIGKIYFFICVLPVRSCGLQIRQGIGIGFVEHFEDTVEGVVALVVVDERRNNGEYGCYNRKNNGNPDVNVPVACVCGSNNSFGSFVIYMVCIKSGKDGVDNTCN